MFLRKLTLTALFITFSITQLSFSTDSESELRHRHNLTIKLLENNDHINSNFLSSEMENNSSEEERGSISKSIFMKSHKLYKSCQASPFFSIAYAAAVCITYGLVCHPLGEQDFVIRSLNHSRGQNLEAMVVSSYIIHLFMVFSLVTVPWCLATIFLDRPPYCWR